jgi:hypothetical protein
MQLIDKIKAGGIALISTVILFMLVCAAAWITHIVECLQEGEWGFLIAGALVFPIAVIHGIGVWCGFW